MSMLPQQGGVATSGGSTPKQRVGTQNFKKPNGNNLQTAKDKKKCTAIITANYKPLTKG